MRIRSTKPEFWRSKRIASVSWDARLVLKGLESYVDDNGVGRDDLELIVTDLFSRDLIREPSRTLARVSEAISDLSEAGLVWRYNVDGDDLLYVSFWELIQRVDKPQPGRLPRPDGTMNYKESEIRESLARAREASRSLAPGTEEQRNRGTEDLKDSCPSPDGEGESDQTTVPKLSDDLASKRQSEQAEFADWWQAYPRKVAKGRAAKAYRAARRKADADTLLAAVRAQSDTLMAKGPEFCPHPTTWLHGERWADEAEPAEQLPHYWRPSGDPA